MTKDQDSKIEDEPTTTVGKAGLLCRCPHCGQGKLYSGVLMPAENCTSCGLDYSFIDSGDGPAVFIILIVGFIIVVLAMAVQSAFHPPMWVHALLWGPTTLILSIIGLRIAKALLIAYQYQSSAEPGTLFESPRHESTGLENTLDRSSSEIDEK